MAEVLFYHLERSSLADVLPTLLERTLAQGWRAAVKTGSAETVEALDQHLWTYHDESFLPHGRGEDERQPVALLHEEEVSVERDVLFLVDGGEVPVTKFSDFTRTVLMFDAEGAERARELWKEIKAAGLEATYWKQSAQGRWEKAG